MQKRFSFPPKLANKLVFHLKWIWCRFLLHSPRGIDAAPGPSFCFLFVWFNSNKFDCLQSLLNTNQKWKNKPSCWDYSVTTVSILFIYTLCWIIHFYIVFIKLIADAICSVFYFLYSLILADTNRIFIEHGLNRGRRSPLINRFDIGLSCTHAH